MSSFIVINGFLSLLRLDWLSIFLNPFLLVSLGFYASFFFYRTLDRSFQPLHRLALTYLFSIGIEHLWVGLVGFTSFNFLAGFAQIVLSPQTFASLNLIHASLSNPAHPLEVYNYSNWPQTPDQWMWSSIALTLIGAIAVAGAVALAKRWSIGSSIWAVISILFLLASILNIILLFTLGQPYEREFFWPLVSIGWSTSYAAAYRTVRSDP